MRSTRYTIIVCCFILAQVACSKSDSPTTTNPPAGGGNNPPACATATPGPLFSQVKAVLTNNCVTCHNPTGQMPTVDFRDNCVIESKAALIKQRAVDLGTMPPTGPLGQADKDRITAWVAAGGKVTD